MKFLRLYFTLFCKGVAMGAADVVPGVSGGTIAFISGIYEQLLDAIGSFNLTALKVLRTRGVAAFWQYIQGTFLSVLLSGILLSIATFARLLTYLLNHHPLLVWGFFFGLIVASVVYIWRQIPLRSLTCWIALVVGTGAVMLIAFAPHLHIPEGSLPHPLYIFGAGALAICAMILPGISGSFVLLLLGIYPVILDAVVDANWWVLALFVAGCATGLLVFSRFLRWLLEHFYSLTLSVLTGFLVGSLVVVWPWQRLIMESRTDPGQEYAKTQLFWPSDYAQVAGESQWLAVVGFMIVGFSLVLILEYAGGSRRDRL